ncbi:MAG: DNA polymerase III subunit gamma/tau [Pseudomonadota bacterium]
MSEKQAPYRVLARKYRPQNFDELIGQNALVRTLTNAIESGRIAHAFMLTGIRGTGKTTTARIIAKALNYTGADGSAGPTTGPTDDCEICKAIAEDRHPDVMEMDAASRTGVDDIREILDGVRYAPTSARYKVYIIDEVHMLSKAAFNALLKTLEEPPEHVKFIFATTEIRKVPVTVLSRCQRFDLRRIDGPTLADYYGSICEKENVKAEDDALSLISRAADGSVRDGLSLLDQAISMSDANVTAEQVKGMLGLADRARVLDLLERSLEGKPDDALNICGDLYNAGVDPSVLIEDMLDFVHVLTKFKAAPKLRDGDKTMPADELQRTADLSAKLSMPSLGRAWQILLKGIGEVNNAPNPRKAAEMIIIRLIYAAELPDPAGLVKKLKDNPQTAAVTTGAVPSGVPANATVQTGGASAALAVEVEAEPEAPKAVETLSDVVAVLESYKEMILASQVYNYVHLVELKKGHLEIRIAPEAPNDLSQNLGRVLKQKTGDRWMVSVSGQPGAPTLAEQAKAEEQKRFDDALADPLVKSVLEIFPDAKLTAVEDK